ncbi:MAG: DUF5714 domain-containing protein [Candidatus Hadarchaeia archaeon]
MKPEEFESCKDIGEYDEFMETSLKYNDLSMEDYEEFMPTVFEVVPDRKGKDPVVMYEKVIEELRKRWTASENLPVHGPWHHGLTAGILINSLRNNGYDFSEEDVQEALERGLMIPGGTCGFHGACGAGTGLGIAVSIATSSNPFHDESRTKSLRASAKIYNRIADLGGPRCCTLSTYTTLDIADDLFREIGYEIPVSEIEGRCKAYRQNGQCHGPECPYFPTG